MALAIPDILFWIWEFLMLMSISVVVSTSGCDLLNVVKDAKVIGASSKMLASILWTNWIASWNVIWAWFQVCHEMSR